MLPASSIPEIHLPFSTAGFPSSWESVPFLLLAPDSRNRLTPVCHSLLFVCHLQEEADSRIIGCFQYKAVETTVQGLQAQEGKRVSPPRQNGCTGEEQRSI